MLERARTCSSRAAVRRRARTVLMTRILLTAAAMFILVSVGGGCSFGGSREPNGLLTRSSERGQGEMTAIVGGTFQVTRDGRCVLLSGKPVVWPADTSLTMDPPRIHLPTGLDASPGDVITGQGGEVPAAGI